MGVPVACTNYFLDPHFHNKDIGVVIDTPLPSVSGLYNRHGCVVVEDPLYLNYFE